jgi:RecA-family ATPase
MGKITLIQGDPGIGKSTSVLALAADVTNGAVPGESDITEPAAVIYQNAEDSYADTIKPNLQRFGANGKLVHFIDESDYPLSLDDELIEQTIIKTDAKLFIADPLTGYSHGSDMHSSNGMHPLMKCLGDVAESTDCTAVLIGHLNKNGSKSTYRALGSIDIYAAARSIFMVVKLPLDDTMRAFVHSKSNLSAPGKSQAFGLDLASGFCWLGDYDATVDEVMSGKPKADAARKADSDIVKKNETSNGDKP